MTAQSGYHRTIASAIGKDRMGEKVTPPVESTERLRAKALREALDHGASPVLTQLTHDALDPSPANGHSANATLSIEKAYLEQILENAPEAICIVDPEMRILRINGEFTRLFGFSTAETAGRPIEALIVPPDRHAETAWIVESVEKGNKL